MSKLKNHIREPAVAGTFYPSRQSELDLLLNSLLSQAPLMTTAPIRALIAPHAGFIYSGAIAANAWRHIQDLPIKRIFLLGPSHHLYFEGIAFSSAAYFATPLGDIKVDCEIVNSLLNDSCAILSDAAHKQEHSLETQLPFIQKSVAPDCAIVPMLVSQPNIQHIADLLEPWAGKPDTLIAVSSDLSHFHHAAIANKIDTQTSMRIEELDTTPLTGECACGCDAVNVLLELARRSAWRVIRSGFCNSGDRSGQMERVVGYGSYLFY